MMAICWKELRENYRWALLALLGLAVAQWYGLQQSQEKYSFGYNYSGKGLLLDSSPFLSVTTFGCAAAGLLLGFVQILPELNRDRWASLLHRPVSRGVVFRGKVAGGLLLYLLATVSPFLFSVWLVATPGHFAAPFLPAMTLAGVADICAGAAFYFAALAMSLPRGVWFGTRVFPLLAAVHLTYAVGSVELFRVAVEAAVLMSLVLFTAGWATLLQQDKFNPRPWLGKIACVVVVFYGVCGLGDLALSLFDVIGPARHTRSVQGYLSDTGVPLRLTYVDNVVVSVLDPSGHAPTERKLQPDQVRLHLEYLNTCSAYIGDSHGWQQPAYPEPYRVFREYATYMQAYTYPQAEQWFYLIKQGIWESFSPTRKIPLERLGRNGFEPLSSPPAPLSAGTRWSDLTDNLILYNSAETTFYSLSQRRRFPLPLPTPGPVYGIGTAYASVGDRSVSVFGVALTDRMAVYNEHGTLVAVLPYHQNVSQWGELSLGMKGDKQTFYLRYSPSEFLPHEVRASMPTYYEEVNARGDLVHSYTVPPSPPYWLSPSWSEYVSHRLQSPTFFFGSMVYQKIGALGGSKRLSDQLERRFGRDRQATKESMVFILTISLALAIGTWFWSRRARFSGPQAWAWAFVVFAGGLAGFIAFLATADWPQLVACSRCRRPRPTDEEQCPHCGAGWPAVAPSGVEIFDGSVTATLAGAPF